MFFLKLKQVLNSNLKYKDTIYSNPLLHNNAFELQHIRK